MSEMQLKRITIIGFGELGRILGHDLADCGVAVSVYDSLLNQAQSRNRVMEEARKANVRLAENLGDAIADAELVISAVTASSALDVARAAANFLRSGQFYMDINSISPETKRKIAVVIGPTGAEFVEAAVMASIAPKRLKVPMLLGGSCAAELASRLRLLGMETTAVSDRIGVASAIKMCRSVMMKGIAALAIESLFAARRYGAEDAVIASFDKTYPNMGWSGSFPDGLIRRAVEHRRRRAAEMREVAETLKDAEIVPFMASSTAELESWLTRELEARNLAPDFSDSFSWRELADALADAEGRKLSMADEASVDS